MRSSFNCFVAEKPHHSLSEFVALSHLSVRTMRCLVGRIQLRSGGDHSAKRKKERTKKLAQAACLIQRFIRARRRLKPVNAVDPLTLEPPQAPVLLLVSAHQAIAYDAHRLREYFEAVHHTIDPLTRRSLNTIELGRLARLTGGPLHIDHDEFTRSNDRRMLAMSLERIAGERLAQLCAVAGAGTERTFRVELSKYRYDILDLLRRCQEQDAEIAHAFVQHSTGVLETSCAECTSAATRTLMAKFCDDLKKLYA